MKRLLGNGQRAEWPESKKAGRRWLNWIAGMGCVLLLTVGGAAFYAYEELQPVDVSGQPVTKNVTIPKGSSVREIGQILEQQGLIRNGTLFAYYVKLKGIGAGLQAGEYQFQTGQSVEQMLQKMTEGDTVANTVRITIPEGWNVEQVADALAKKGMINKQKFLQEINRGSFPEYPFVAAIPQKAGRKYRLEGYLFPETYELKKGSTEREIIATMLAQFQKELKPEWTSKLKQRNMSLDDAVNLASIVEREVVVDKERPIVAGVYYNRLREGWLLQADATVQFILGKQRDRITYDDLKIKNPYNTYVYPGLPPGPIANPGRASLAAVVEPATHEYFFYVTKKDGSSEHYFSRTLEEHLAKDALSRQKQ